MVLAPGGKDGECIATVVSHPFDFVGLHLLHPKPQFARKALMPWNIFLDILWCRAMDGQSPGKLQAQAVLQCLPSSYFVTSRDCRHPLCGCSPDVPSQAHASHVWA